MTKPEIRVMIRTWVRDILPSLSGEYTLKDLYSGLRTLFNDNSVWDTKGKNCSIGEYMVRMEILRAKRLGQGVNRVSSGIYVFG